MDLIKICMKGNIPLKRMFSDCLHFLLKRKLVFPSQLHGSVSDIGELHLFVFGSYMDYTFRD